MRRPRHIIEQLEYRRLLSQLTIMSGQTVTGVLGSNNPTDQYTFAAVPGDNIMVVMGAASNLLYPRIDLFGPDGKVITSETGAPGNIATIFPIRATESGQYSIVASSQSGIAGSYRLTLAELPATQATDPEGGEHQQRPGSHRDNRQR